MGFFDNIRKGISDFSQATIQKGKDTVNVTKFNRMITDENKTITKLMEKLGQRYYALYGEAPEESMRELVEGIRECEARIREYEENIKELQGITKCPACGADVPNGAAFCPECGTPFGAPAAEGEPQVVQGKPIDFNGLGIGLGLVPCILLLLLAGIGAWELVRSMWSWEQPLNIEKVYQASVMTNELRSNVCSWEQPSNMPEK